MQYICVMCHKNKTDEFNKELGNYYDIERSEIKRDFPWLAKSFFLCISCIRQILHTWIYENITKEGEKCVSAFNVGKV